MNGILSLRQVRIFGCCIAFLLPGMAVHAGEGVAKPDKEEERIVAPLAANEYRADEKGIERLNQAQSLAPLSVDTLFGEQVSLFNGGTEFSSTDISIPGNEAPPVELRRVLLVDDRSRVNGNHIGGFAEWDLDLPRLSSVVVVAKGWRPAGGTVNQRCSVPGPLEDTATVAAEDYWDGYKLHIPGAGDLALLMSPAISLPDPGNGTVYPWITKGMWRISCKSATKNGYAGQAFIATSPAGVKYHLDWVIEKTHAGMRGELNSLPLVRQVVHFLVSRVEDRFGNWVDYTYSSDKLTGMVASDGRQIALTWSGNKIASVSSSIGTWSYAYTGEKLTSVTRPDASKWQYSSTGALAINAPGWSPSYEDPTGCPESFEEPTGSYALTITAPSGASAAYGFSIRKHDRSNIPAHACYINSPQYWFMKTPRFFWSLTLVSKNVSGPGLVPASWTYSYGLSGALAPDTKINAVSGPDSTYSRYTYGTGYNLNEGQLLKVERGASASQILLVQQSTYVTDAEAALQNFPSSVGDDPRLWSDLLANAWLRPLKSSAASQQGVTFNSGVDAGCSGKLCYDVFARPTKETRSSSLGFSRTEASVYHDNLPKWVLGQVASRTVGGVTVESTTFSATTAQPLTYSSYGKLQQTLTYNADGTVATVKDGNNNVTTLSSWKRGIPQSIGYPDGKSRSAVVNDSGWITQVTDENGYATSYSYDAMGRLASIAYPSGDSTVWNTTTQVFQSVNVAEYGIPAGHWRQTVSTGNARKLTYYDALWRPLLTHEYDTANVSGTQRFQRFTYDHEGRTTFASYPGSSDALSTGTRTVYDALGRPTSVSQNSESGVLTTTTEYLAGFMTRTTNPRGQQTLISYMAWDQPTTAYPMAAQQPGGVYTDISRDAFGKPTAITQRNSSSSVSVTRRYVYDGYQQLCKSIEPETGSTVMAYDNAGNLAWSASGQALPSASSCDTASVAGSQKVSRSYDARNRLVTLTFPGGNGNQSWTYTADGLPDTVTTWNEGGSTYVSNSYMYNRRRLLAGESQSQTAGQAVWSIGYGYNGNGHLTSLIYPGGMVLDYLPNALGQPTKAGSFATGVQYHPNGAMKQFTYGNGLVHTMTQNARQLPARSTDSGGVLDLAYAYDANGNVSSITDYTSAARQTRSMGYDERDRLTSVSSLLYPGGASYTYDVLDNITRATVGSRDHVYWYDANNRLTNVLNGPGGPSIIGLGYDVRGNVINKNGNLFVFDHGNRLRTAQGTDTYRYDAQGRRVRTAGSDGLLYEVYNLGGQLLWQRDEQIGMRYEHIYLNGSVVAIRRRPIGAETEDVFYWHNDALGSQIAATQGTTVAQTTEHEPYGRMINRTNNNRIGYTGHVMDQATGLIYMQQRYYDPLIPRFLSVDPITAYSNPVGAFNRYWYANNNPYRFIDPDGRKASMLDHPGIPISSVSGVSPEVKGNYAATEANRSLVRSGSVRSYGSESSMHKEWGGVVYPISKKWGVEIMSHTYSLRSGGYIFGPALSSGHSTQIIGGFGRGFLYSNNVDIIGFIHTHPGSGAFSGEGIWMNGLGEERCTGNCGEGDIRTALLLQRSATLVYGDLIRTFDARGYLKKIENQVGFTSVVDSIK